MPFRVTRRPPGSPIQVTEMWPSVTYPFVWMYCLGADRLPEAIHYSTSMTRSLRGESVRHLTSTVEFLPRDFATKGFEPLQ